MTQVAANEPIGEELVGEELEAAPVPPALDHASVRLSAPIIGHTGVDYLSFVGVALLPLLAQRVGFDEDVKALLLGLGAVASGTIQPLVAWIGDKFDTRIFGPLGVLVAVFCVGALGWVHSLAVLVPLWILMTAGVGAFHPPGAAATGQLAGRKRSAMLAIFFLAGMIGGILGNVVSPVWVSTFAAWSGSEGELATTAGLRSLALMIPGGVLLAAFLWWAIRRVGHRHADAHERHAALSPRDRRRRWGALWVLYIGNVVRFPVNVGLVYLLVEWTTQLTRERAAVGANIGVEASQINGPMQAALQLGMGAGGLALGLLLHPRIEKPAFVGLPILGAVPIVLMPYCDQIAGPLAVVAAFTLAVAAGVCFGGMFPVALSLGQRLLPHRTGLASGMLMGGAWFFGFFGAQVARVLHVGARPGTPTGILAEPFGLTGARGEVGLGLEKAFVIVAIALALSGLWMMLLPGRLLREIDPH